MVSKSQVVLAIVYVLLVVVGDEEFVAARCRTFQNVTTLVVFTKSTGLLSVGEAQRNYYTWRTCRVHADGMVFGDKPLVSVVSQPIISLRLLDKNVSFFRYLAIDNCAESCA
jgi:hypothetical protein